MDCKVTFDVIKNIIIEQNKVFLKEIADATGLDYDMLCEKYLRREYYLPLVLKTSSTNGNTVKK